MLHQILSEILQKNLYIVHSERYRNELGKGKFERIIAKHPLLKPKLIIVNDQLHGFKKVPEKAKSLEEFPIFAEIDYVQDEETNQIYVTSAELYSEATIKIGSHLKEVLKLSQLYNHAVYLERIKRLDDPSEESIIIYSKLNELILEETLQEDLEEGFMTEPEINHILEEKITGFITFIKLLDSVLFKGLKVNQVNLFNKRSDKA